MALSDLQKIILLFIMERGGFASSQAIIENIWGCSLTPKEPEYAKAHSSLSRSLGRLWGRGLVDLYKKVPGAATGTPLTIVGLTPYGAEWAAYLEHYG